VLSLIVVLPLRGTKKYVVGMDNFFTFSRTIVAARERHVAIVGTAKAKTGWPPRELYPITDSRCNTLHWINDKDHYQIQRWVDNNVVTMVTTMYEASESISQMRKKHRSNAINKRHLDLVWGAGHKVPINIPTTIDDYNHWMLGVDRADRLISIYRPITLRCKRIWVPIMFHALDLMRINSVSEGNHWPSS
jgi:hypothetical protein